MVLHTRGRVGRRHFTKALSSLRTRGFFFVCAFFTEGSRCTFLPLLLPFSHSLSLAFYLPSDYQIDIYWSLYILCFGGICYDSTSHFNRKR